MSEEATLLALLRDRPDDRAARLVYADWLEERGLVPRAEILRAIDALADLDLDTEDVVARASGLLAMRTHEDPAWLAAIDRRDLVAGTVWATKSNSGEAAMIGFHPGGKLSFRRANGRWPGVWSVMGNAVTFTINDYSPHDGVFFGDRMTGVATNKGDQRWTWGAIKLANPALLEAKEFAIAAIPEDTPKDSSYGFARTVRRRRETPSEPPVKKPATAAKRPPRPRGPRATASPGGRRRSR